MFFKQFCCSPNLESAKEARDFEIVNRPTSPQVKRRKNIFEESANQHSVKFDDRIHLKDLQVEVKKTTKNQPVGEDYFIEW